MPGVRRWTAVTGIGLWALLVAAALLLVVGDSAVAPPQAQHPSAPVDVTNPAPQPLRTAAPPAPSTDAARRATAATSVYDGPVATSLSAAAANAYAWGIAPGRFDRAALVVLDRQASVFYISGDVDAGYRTASLVKLFLAARMLVEGQPLDRSTQDLLWRMITCSDDGAASELWRRLGREQTITWAAARYGIGAGLQPPPRDRPSAWGLTSVSARALVTFYQRVADDPAVGPWLMDAMGQAAEQGCDGYYQHFGLPSAFESWRVKQGWIRNHNGHAYLHSTGFVENDRYIVVLLTEGPSRLYDGTGPGSGRWLVTGMAQALAPLHPA